MKKQRTALSVRARRRRQKMSYRTLEARQLLAADVFTANALQTCNLNAPAVETVAQIEHSVAETDMMFAGLADTTDDAMSRQLPVGVSEVIIDGGTDSRSIVRSITIIFDGIVDPQTDAIQIIQRESGSAVDLRMTVDNSSGVSHVRLTFSGDLATGSGSLVDGNYKLNVIGDLLGSSSGGVDFVFGDQAEDNLYRFFADSNGDRNIDVFDVLGLRKTYLHTEDDAGFDAQFDENADGIVNVFDLLSFRSNWGETLDFV